MASKRPAGQPAPHDQLIKQLLQADLAGFVRLFYPSLAAQVDFHQIDWMDKELFADMPAGARRETDVLARLTVKDAAPVAFLLLIEIEDREGRKRDGVTLQERLFLYYSLLWARYRMPVYPLVLYLFRSKGGLRRHRHRHTLLGDVVNEFRFRSIGLPRLDAHGYLRETEAIAGALGALMAPGRWSRAEHKAACLETIGRSKAPAAVKLLATNCVETYLELTAPDQAEFESLLEQEEYMEAWKIEKTWAERMEEKGAIIGQRKMLLKLLRLKFGALPERVSARVEAISTPEELDVLAERILVADSLDALGLD